MSRIANPVAIVTGGAQGIGKAIVARLLADGHAVVIADDDRAASAEAATEHGQTGHALVQRTDVADERSVRRMVQAALARFGRIDALISNAGLADPESGPLADLTLAAWNRTLAVDLTGTFLCAKHAVPALRAARGTIITIASTRAFQSEPGTEAYAAAKGGLVALTHALAISLGPEVRTACISPGWIATSAWKKAAQRAPAKLRRRDHAQHPVGRVGQPEDVADLAAFLISPRAGFITGQNFIVDGGMTRKMIYAR